MQLNAPFTCMVVGPTRSGKTQWCRKLVEHANKLLNPFPSGGIIWCYKVWQPAYDGLTGVDFHQGLPDDLDALQSSGEHRLLILDDFMVDLSKDNRLVELFTVGAHHWKISVIHITQSLFFGKNRTARINAHYLVLMKSNSDRLQIVNLAKQLFPGQNKYFMDAYNDAVNSQPYGYLLVDCSPTAEEGAMLLTNIFPGDDGAQFITTYLPRKT